MESVDGVLLVLCTGNVCRSPYAERRLRQELAGTAVRVHSAGTAALVDRDMDPLSAQLLARAGADAAGFRARQLTPDLLASADLVVAAAREHRSAAARLHPATLRRAMTLRDLADLLEGTTPDDVLAHGGEGSWVRRVGEFASSRRGLVPARQDGVDVTDPIGAPEAVFVRMADEVEDAVAVVGPVLRGPAR